MWEQQHRSSRPSKSLDPALRNTRTIKSEALNEMQKVAKLNEAGRYDMIVCANKRNDVASSACSACTIDQRVALQRDLDARR
ncbi:uncharacterized protein UMAG_10171 [Mycosarcoma maydis]|uniref:Uncharacterized protein n=1 Tax=Mycosarcoma maydis TaxID=5270 RepID=A0A0D1E1Q5_MYCMD|nr:uncharacterized protein UMAG_10171 [Ustilago maydis 521]KIS70024.1 hypothetical protein UMAG_10171 [Ustilago maydis 521]|eukprot:XP_011388334.1 hypothetical protein UMAG_10171 [Ustilago maydis 521]